ncbi:DUF1572 family protein [uncultured Mucilaginibacter sp.]|uniref:DUF1572 family protein n=1 Tax=uncultured Mucilaginibacter sp. TaxID=797541 RepID=UPI0025D8D677|nr:DUF1572 family protein [uncultured Mucilaginibacter sp.]
MQSIGENYLLNSKKLFAYYKSLGDKAIERTSEDDLHWQYNAQSNSMAAIIKHMAGNSLSRWTDFLTTDGEKPWRNRDNEFEDEHLSKAKLIAYWNKGWQCLFDAIDPLTHNDLLKTIYIRGEAHTVIEAINRQLAHLTMHVGQIVFIAKMIAGDDWVSLTIPKGKSKEFNNQKFGGVK